MQKGIGWRKTRRAALADSPFVKGEGSRPRPGASCCGMRNCRLLDEVNPA